MYTLLSAAIFGHSSNKDRTPPQICSGIPHGESLRNLLDRFEWGKDPKLGLLRRVDGGKETQKDADGTRAALMNTQTTVEAAGVIEDALVTRLAKALAISMEDIDVAQPMHAYGVDSLVAVEVRNWLMRELQADSSVFDILGTTPISQLSVKIVETSKLLSMKFDNEKQETGVVKVVPEEEAGVDQSLGSEKKVDVSIVEVVQETVLPALAAGVEMLKKPVVDLVERAGSDSGNSDDYLLVEGAEPPVVEVVA